MATIVALRSVWFPNASDLTNQDLLETAHDSVRLFQGASFDEAARKAFAAAEAEIAEHNDSQEEAGYVEAPEERLRLVHEASGDRDASWFYGCEGAGPGAGSDAEDLVLFYCSEQTVE